MRLHPYKDTVGVLTIGVGHNLDEGISEHAAMFILEEDIAAHEGDCRREFRWYSGLDACRQDAVTDMCFNLGIARLLGFHRFLAAMETQQWDTAAMEMLDSQWAGQVGGRATELATMIRTGMYA